MSKITICKLNNKKKILRCCPYKSTFSLFILHNNSNQHWEFSKQRTITLPSITSTIHCASWFPAVDHAELHMRWISVRVIPVVAGASYQPPLSGPLSAVSWAPHSSVSDGCALLLAEHYLFSSPPSPLLAETDHSGDDCAACWNTIQSICYEFYCKLRRSTTGI